MVFQNVAAAGEIEIAVTGEADDSVRIGTGFPVDIEAPLVIQCMRCWVLPNLSLWILSNRVYAVTPYVPAP